MDKFQAKHLSHEQILRITNAVVQAELKTTGEIVPMIVSRSSAVGHLPLQCGLLILTTLLLLIFGFEPTWFFFWKWKSLIVLILLSFGAGYLLSRFNFIQRWMIPDKDEEAQVWQRAQSEWAANKIQKTANRTGILLFVSVMERKAIVLADEGIAKHYPAETWKEVVELLTSHLRQGDWAMGFEKAIEKCGEILSKHLPAGPKNPNEITDHLIIKN